MPLRCFQQCVNLSKVTREDNDKKVLLKTVECHLEQLSTTFSKYFFAEEDIKLSDWNWVKNPFEITPTGLSLQEEEQLTDLSSSTAEKSNFGSKSLANFWSELSCKNSLIKAKAFRLLLPFPTSYLFGTGFSAAAALKSKY